MSPSLDRELVHSWLWENRGRNDILTMTQGEMAKRLRLSKYTPSRLLAQLEIAGKVVKIRGGKFVVIDPEKTDRL